VTFFCACLFGPPHLQTCCCFVYGQFWMQRWQSHNRLQSQMFTSASGLPQCLHTEAESMSLSFSIMKTAFCPSGTPMHHAAMANKKEMMFTLARLGCDWRARAEGIDGATAAFVLCGQHTRTTRQQVCCCLYPCPATYAGQLVRTAMRTRQQVSKPSSV